MKYAYYPGCSAHSTARDMHESSLAVADALGIADATSIFTEIKLAHGFIKITFAMQRSLIDFAMKNSSMNFEVGRNSIVFTVRKGGRMTFQVKKPQGDITLN